MSKGFTRRELSKLGLAGAALAGLAGAGSLVGCGSGGNTEDEKQAVLKRLPSTGLPKPVDYIRTNWSRDPLTLCSYSYLAPTPFGARLRKMLAEPVGRIVFAGEATAEIPATVHGAIQAGQSAASLIAERMPSGARIALVGAGAAGLACAGALTDAGFEPVLLEASDRVGGRVRSADLDGYPVELGASWIHGVKGNPLTSLADQAGIGLHPFTYEANFPVPGQKRLADRGEQRFNQAIAAFRPHSPGANEQTVDWLLPSRQGPGLRWAVEIETAQDYGADPDQLAAMATWEGEWLGGGDALLGGRYGDLIEGLAGDAETRFGFDVRRIEQQGDKVTLSGKGGEEKADAAVVTVPIGVLKAGIIDFKPGLPNETKTAIEGLGAGLLDKVWLAFDEPFWDERVAEFGWINPKKPGRWGFWVNSQPVIGKPFLMTLSGGKDAHRLARKSDYEVISETMQALAEMFG